MDFAGKAVDARGEFGGIWDEVAGGVALAQGPAVVDVDVGVAEVAEAKGDESAGGGEGDGGGGGVALGLVLGRRGLAWLADCVWESALAQEFQPRAGVRPTPLSRRFWLTEREEAPVMARPRMASLVAMVESLTRTRCSSLQERTDIFRRAWPCIYSSRILAWRGWTALVVPVRGPVPERSCSCVEPEYR